MTLLNFFHSGLLGPVVLVLGIAGLFLTGRASYRRYKAGIGWGNGYTYFFALILTLWIIAIWNIASDYKGV